MKTARDVIRLFEDETPDNFLPAALVMLDLEMTGVVPERDDVLQIAALKLELKDNQYVAVGESLNIFLKNDKQPGNAFQKEFLVDVFAKANASDVTIADAKQQISDWLGDLKGLVTPTGDAIQQDLAFLYAKGLIDRGDIVNDKNVPGTFHYEIFDMNAIKLISRQKTGVREELELEDGVHNADVDCRNQLKELNYYLSAILG